MKKILVVLLACFLTGCAYKHSPVYNVDDTLPIGAQSLPLDKIEAAIVEGGQVRGWTFQRVGDGHLQAAQEQEKYSAVVDIYFDQKRWRTQYKSSVGLRAQGDTIHAHYNFWIRNLESDVNNRLGNAAIIRK